MMKKTLLSFAMCVLASAYAWGQTITPVVVPANPDYSWIGGTNSQNQVHIDDNTTTVWTNATGNQLWGLEGGKYCTKVTGKNYLFGKDHAYSYTGLGIRGQNNIYVTTALTIASLNTNYLPTSDIYGNASLNIIGGAVDLLAISALNGTAMANDLHVGANSTGTLNIQDGTLSQTGSTGSICVGYGTNGVGILNVSGNSTITTPKYFILGDSNTTTKGTMTMTGGDITAGEGLYVGYKGTAEMWMNGGTFTSKKIMYVSDQSGTGTLHLDKAGTIVSNGLNIGNAKGTKGEILMTGGAFNVNSGEVFIGNNGSGSFIQTGGTINMTTGNFSVAKVAGSEGVFTFNHGIIRPNNLDIAWGGKGTMNIGGDARIIENGSSYFCVGNQNTCSATVNQSGDSYLEGGWFTLGHRGTTVYNMSGGTMYCRDATNDGNHGIQIGDRDSSFATVNLSGGTMKSVGYFFVARDTDGKLNTNADTAGTGGILNQTGGTIISPYIRIGDSAKAKGLWNMSGGLVDIGSRMDIGNAGTGTLKLSGGTIQHTGVRADRWFCIGSAATGVGLVEISGGKLDVDDLCVADLGTGTMRVSGGTVIGRNWYLNGWTSGTGKTFQTGGDITTGWFILGFQSAGKGTHEMYGGTLTETNLHGNPASVGYAGTGYLNMYGGKAKFVNLTAGVSGGNGHITFSGGDASVSGNMTLNGASDLTFSAGTQGFGSLKVTGTYTDNRAAKTVKVEDGAGVAFVDNYDPAKGVDIMTVGAGTLAVDYEGDMYKVTTTNGDKTINVKMNDDLGKGTISAIFGKLVLDEASKKGWVLLDDMTGDDPFQITLAVEGLNDGNKADFLADLNADMMVGEKQVWEASEGLASDEVIIKGLSTMDLPTNIFSWDFNLPQYDGFALMGAATTAVPEPATWVLLLLGFGVWGIRLRKSFR